MRVKAITPMHHALADQRDAQVERNFADLPTLQDRVLGIGEAIRQVNRAAFQRRLARSTIRARAMDVLEA